MRNSGSNWEHVSRGKILWAPRRWNQASIKRLRSAPFSFEGISHLCVFGVKDPKRRALKRPVRYLTDSRQLLRFVIRKCANKRVHGPETGLTDAYWSSSRWRTRAWAQAVIRGVESDAVRKHEAYLAEDVEMDLTGADIPDDEFSEERRIEEAESSRRNTQQSRVFTRIWDIPARGIPLSHFTNWWS